MDVDVRELLAQLGAELRHARIQANLTQADVGAAAGVSRQLVNRMKTGHNGEISSYIATAKALRHRLKATTTPPPNASEQAAMDLVLQLQETNGPAQ
jgi:transcriptional regulator with XRE-family HTH domain